MSGNQDVHVAYKAVLLAAALVVLGLLFRELATLFLAVLLTIIIAIPLSAGATRLERHRVPRPLGALAMLLLGIAVLAGILALIIPAFVHETNKFVNEVPGIVDHLERTAGDVTGKQPSQVGNNVQTYLQRYTNHPERLIAPVTSIGVSIAGIVAAIILMVITAYYMAVRPQPLVDGVLSLVPPRRRAHTRHIMDRLRSAWIGWMQGVLIHMVLSGTLLYVGLRIIGLDFAIVFAVLTALLVVIPYLGVVVGAIPPVLFALTQSPGEALLVLAVYVGVHEVEANLIVPVVMARATKLHPAAIAVGVIAVERLFGIVGLIVAVPLITTVVILVQETWVREIEKTDAIRAAEALQVPEGLPASEVREPLSPRA
jgi:predicted PurR-regulated permease PerM